MPCRLIECASDERVSARLSHEIINQANKAIQTRNRFVIAFSGGSLPAVVAISLLKLTGVDFRKWVIVYCDERLVPLEHPDSNHRLLVEQFQSKLPAENRPLFVPLDAGLIKDPAACAAAYERRLREFCPSETDNSKNSVPIIDCALLGVGPDGHTCSLFPGHRLLEDGDDAAVSYLTDSPKPPAARITLTFAALKACRQIFVVATGAGKSDIVRKVFTNDKDAAKFPISRVVRDIPNVIWFSDRPATDTVRGKCGAWTTLDQDGTKEYRFETTI